MPFVKVGSGMGIPFSFALDRHRGLLLALCAFAAVFASKLLLISLFGSDLPYWDQWDAEGAALYGPYFNRGIGAIDWFSAHNEHRIVLTRLTALLLLKLNGQWDALVQTCFNAVIHAACGAMLVGIVIRFHGITRISRMVILLIVAGFSLPYGWENTLAGFQNQFYYFLVCAILLLYLATDDNAASKRNITFVLLLGAVSLVTVASGALVCLTGAVVLTSKAVLSPAKQDRRRIGVGIAGLLALFILGAMTAPSIPGHAVLKAHTLSQFSAAFISILAWPTSIAAPLIWCPFVALLIWYAASAEVRAKRIALFVLALGVLVLLNSAATALSRAVAATTSRYTDVIWLGCLVNAWAFFLLAQVSKSDLLARVIGIGGQLFTVFALTSLGVAGWVALDGARERKSYADIQTTHVREFVRTRDPANLLDKPFLHIPYPSAQFLREQLMDPAIRSILPPSIRERLLQNGVTVISPDPLQARSDPPLSSDPAPALIPSGNRQLSRFTSTSISPTSGHLKFGVSGYLGRPDLFFHLEAISDHTRVAIKPLEVPGERWRDVDVVAPAGPFRVLAENASTNPKRWFAFTDPTEVGRLRVPVDWMLDRAPTILSLAWALFVVSFLGTDLNNAYGRLAETSDRR